MNTTQADGLLRIVTEAGGGVVFDPHHTPALDRAWFALEHWRDHGAPQPLAGGRGGVHRVQTPAGAAILRHYRRGGMVARVAEDRFVWTGVERVRSLREFRLTWLLHREGFPVPLPLGGAWTRVGRHYRADLLTAELPRVRALAAMLAEALGQPELAARTGSCVARFHARGVDHADLNAHNILIDSAGTVSLIDFDRGRLRRPRRAWQRANLARLLRSLRKIAAAAGLPADAVQRWWETLSRAHAAHFAGDTGR